MRRAAATVATSAVLLVGLATPAGAAPPPAGYRRTRAERIAPGVLHETYVRDEPDQVVHVARIAKTAPVSLRVVRAAKQPDGPSLARPSSLCARVRCLAAVNGDFFQPGTGEVIGSVVSSGIPVRSPSRRHHQLTITADRALHAGVVDWRITLVSTDLRSTELAGVNVGRGPNQIVLYTSEQGTSTRTNPHGVEIVGQVVEPRAPLRLGQTSLVKLTAIRRSGNNPIPADGVVLSGHGKGARALEDLWERVRTKRAGANVLLRVESDPPARESLGGAPVLVRDGKRYVAATGPSFVTGRHPRTAVGWTARGDVLMVTVDGRQQGYSLGLSLPELADLMVGLGAVEALNLDGGGSTAFVRQGRVVNRPSDRLVSGRRAVHLPGDGQRVLGNIERPVANVLAVVPLMAAPAPRDPLARDDIGIPTVDPGPPLLAADPGSNPNIALPALLVTPGARLPVLPVGVATGLAALMSVLTTRRLSGRFRATSVAAAGTGARRAARRRR